MTGDYLPMFLCIPLWQEWEQQCCEVHASRGEIDGDFALMSRLCDEGGSLEQTACEPAS